MVQSGADLPQSVLDLAKPDLNDKKRVKRQKIEREELQTKVPKCNFEATERVRDFINILIFTIISKFSYTWQSFKAVKNSF